MVDVSVGKEYKINLFGIKQKWLVIESHDLFWSLKHSAVYEKFSGIFLALRGSALLYLNQVT